MSQEESSIAECQINLKMPREFFHKIEKASSGMYRSKQEFIMEAVREKFERDASMRLARQLKQEA